MNSNGSETIRLYHGSPERDFTPTFGLGRDQHDYGRGFYLTEFPDLAREWAVAASPGTDGWLHAYDLRLEGLRIVDFTTLGSLPWLAELMKHRNADESRYYRENSVKFIARYGIDLGDADVVRAMRSVGMASRRTTGKATVAWTPSPRSLARPFTVSSATGSGWE